MHISAICPGCGTSYQVSPTLRGQQMRCPLSTCRTTFTVAPEPPAAPPPPPPPLRPQRSGSVGDMVPILPSESAVPVNKPEMPRSQTFHVSDMVPLVEAEAVAPPSKPADAPSWQQAPPPARRGQNGEAPRSKPAAPSPQLTPPVVDELVVVEEMTVVEEVVAVEEIPVVVVNDGAPRELPPGQWEPPPIRRGPGAESAVLDVVSHHPETLPDEYAPRRSKTRRNLLVMAGIVMSMMLVLGVLGAVIWFVVRDSEENFVAQADEAYHAKLYGKAEGLYKRLYDQYPTSGRHDEYGYLTQLCGLRSRVSNAPTPVAELDEVEKYFEEHKDDPYFKQYGNDFGETAVKALLDFTAAPTIDDTTPDAVTRAETLLGALKETLGNTAIRDDDEQKLGLAFIAIRQRHADWVYRAAVVKVIEDLAKTPNADTIRTAKHYLKVQEGRLPGISQAADTTALIEKMKDGHLASIVYDGPGEQPKPGPREDVQPCILVDANLQGSASLPPGKVVLALVRGVLYALRHSDGKAIWAMRVGIDTSIPPVRVPAVAGLPELILVLSTDTKTLTALNDDGGEVWHYSLSQPCLGRPVVVDQRAFLPTLDGQVLEIELRNGTLLGRYQLGQRLTHGGVREGKTPRLYFPADDSCVYVLNVADHKCEAILYSDHLADTLRGEPLIVGTKNDPDKATGWLILSQSQPLDDVQLRVFELPIKPRQATELPLKTPLRLPGLTWFPPHQDGEKLAMLTDAGMLGLFGIHQERNRDDVLFPWLPGSGALSLDPFLPPHGKERGPAEVIEVQGNDLWVLAHGHLQRLQLVLGGKEGMRPVAVWEKPVPLGSPLHASQVEDDRVNGRSTLFLVTRALSDRTCLATAVDDETGVVHWKRQLGFVCQGKPLSLKAAGDDGLPLVLALDQGGGLFAFDPKRFDPEVLDQWQSGGKLVAPPLPQNPRLPPLLLPAPDGESAFEIACPGDGQELVIRYLRADDQRQIKLVRERQVPLEAPLAGTPAFFDSVMILPLADGNLYRLFWKQQEMKLELGQDWRAKRAAADAPCHVLPLGTDRYLCTDGSRGLKVFQVDKTWTPLPKGSDGEGSTLDLTDRLIAPPVLLSRKPLTAPGALGVWSIPVQRGAPESALEICVADSAGVVSLLSLGGDGSLKVKRHWALKGRITAGPFLRWQYSAPRLACVVERRKGEQQLVWLDPDEDEVCWEYRAAGEIEGQPEMVDGLLVIAEESGRYKALEPATGQPVGPGYLLKGSIAPAASPVSFGSERLFAPLSDGTVMLLSMKQLRRP